MQLRVPIRGLCNFEPSSLPNEFTLERVRSSEHRSPHELTGGPAVLQSCDTPILPVTSTMNPGSAIVKFVAVVLVDEV